MDQAFRDWVTSRASDSFDETNPFERGLKAAYQDVFVRMVDGDANEANKENEK